MYWSTCPKGKLKQATNGNWNNSTSQIAIQWTGTLLYIHHGKVQKKTMTWFTGEHLLWSSASFAGIEASIGLIVGKDE
jgi:hypothetical protein